MAAGVLFEARERNISVPEDVSVVGFDDTPLARESGALDHRASANSSDGEVGG